MQTKKILVVSLSLLLAALALPTTSVNRAHAFTSPANNSVTVSNVLNGFTSPTIGSGTVAQSGSSLSITVVIQASSFTPAYQRNVTIGVKGDWMTAYQNASILTLTTNQIASTTISVSLPTVNSISPSHAWSVQVWDGPASGTVANCVNGDAENNPGSGTTKSCFILASGFISILTGDQYSAAQARNAARTAILGAGGLTDETARGQLAQANTEISLGDSSWTNGDFGGAKTHYQNAQNDANAALATQVNLGGGATNAGIVGALESGTGILLFGLGGLLAGFGGFFYLRRRPKA